MHVLLGPAASIPLLVAPMGASAVLLFAVPASPLAQPWSIIGGNLVSASVGVAGASWIADRVGAAALAVALAICLMFALRCVPPVRRSRVDRGPRWSGCSRSGLPFCR